MTSLNLQYRIKGLAQVHYGRVLANPDNWRLHPIEQREALLGVFADVGVIEAVLVVPTDVEALESLCAVRRGDTAAFVAWITQYKGEFMLCDGHLRTEEIGRHGDGSIDILVLDLNPSEMSEVLATKDPIGALATTNKSKLMELARDFQTTSPALQKLLVDVGAIEVGMRERIAASQADAQAASEGGPALLMPGDDGGPPIGPSSASDAPPPVVAPPPPAVGGIGGKPGDAQTTLYELKFGTRRMLMTASDADELTAKLDAYLREHGTLHGVAARMIAGL